MRRYEWDEYFPFPPPGQADRNGMVGWGGNLSPGILLSAYRQGLFPWYSTPPPAWFSPDPRFVLFPSNLHISESLRKVIKKGTYQVTFDRDFSGVIAGCRSTPRPGQDGTWITDDVVEGYTELHHLGFAHSVEVRKDGVLVGGLYGLRLGQIFFGESMFSHAPNASKVGFATVMDYLVERLGIKLVDCQAYTPYLESFGARLISRSDFYKLHAEYMEFPGDRGPWR